jgi:aminoglycoside 6'-N-acetyltransferase
MHECRYEFRPMTAQDLPMVQRWLQTSHVRQWWGDPVVQFGLVSEDLAHPAIDQFIVTADDRPFAYLQCYDPTPWPDHGFGDLPAGVRGIDQFIGEADMIERGHGSAMVKRFVDTLLATGTPSVITDPDPANSRAIRAYEKAGFERLRLVDTPNGPALLMVRNS